MPTACLYSSHPGYDRRNEEYWTITAGMARALIPTEHQSKKGVTARRIFELERRQQRRRRRLHRQGGEGAHDDQQGNGVENAADIMQDLLEDRDDAESGSGGEDSATETSHGHAESPVDMSNDVTAADRLLEWFDVVVWGGDLNYRVEFSDWVGPDGSLDKTKAPHELKMRQVKRLIEHQKWDVLQAADELQREMAAGRVFAGFIDSPCDFPPTFKVERGYELQYNDKRVPSYCDRILHCSKAGYERCLHQEAFNAGFNLITSDHKPVWGRYHISVPRDFTLRQSAAAQPGLHTQLAPLAPGWG